MTSIPRKIVGRCPAVAFAAALVFLALETVPRAAPVTVYAVQARTDREDAKYTMGDKVVFTIDEVDTYALTMRNFNGTNVRCYFSKPRGDGPFPCSMEVHGAGTMSIEPDPVATFARRGVMAIDMCPHDVELGLSETAVREFWDAHLKGYPRRGNDSRDRSSFLQMFCGNYRTARYITSRPEWDRTHFVVHGSSQGGGQCLATAYLCPQVTAFNAYKGPRQVLEKPLVAHQQSLLWREVSRKFIDQELGLTNPR